MGVTALCNRQDPTPLSPGAPVCVNEVDENL
jgi:hypothetical protein